MKNNILINLFKKRRGFSDEEYELIKSRKTTYDYENSKLLDIDKACQILNDYKNKEITIIPDYDADGIMSGVIAYAGLSELGFHKTNIYYPSSDTGYGMSKDSLKEALLLYPNTELIFTCDNGISSIEAIDYALTLGIPTLVTDHHPEIERSSAIAIVNPHRLDEEYPFKGLSGATVVWKTLFNYSNIFDIEKRAQIIRLSVFAGISTITDVMPHLEENRPLINFMEKEINKTKSSFDKINNNTFCDSEVYRNSFLGLNLLVSTLSNNNNNALESDFIGYYLGPCLNSSRRVTSQSSYAFNVFIESDLDKKREYISYLIELNSSRKNHTAIIWEDFKSKIDNGYTGLFFGTDFESRGYSGLVASKITTYINKPSIVLYKDIKNPTYYSGSGRSPSWFDLTHHLAKIKSENPTLDFTFGGHSVACGISVEESHMTILENHLIEESIKVISEIIESGNENILSPVDLNLSILNSSDKKYDMNIDNQNSNIVFEFIYEILSLKPFGNGFESPRVSLTIDLELFKTWNIGSEKQHTKLKHKSLPLEILIWNDLLPSSERVITLHGSFSINEFRGESLINFTRN